MGCNHLVGRFFDSFIGMNSKFLRDQKIMRLGTVSKDGVLVPVWYSTMVQNDSGFGSKYGAGHFRLVYLPPIATLESAMNKIESFCASR